MSIWTWWMPSRKAIDKVVETQDDDDEHCNNVNRAKVNRFYRRQHNRNKHIMRNQLNSKGGFK
jgi:hypothetical protein